MGKNAQVSTQEQIKTAVFKRTGGKITARVRGGYAHPGGYTFTLWDLITNTRVPGYEKISGKLGDEKEIVLLRPNELNNNKIASADVSITVVSPILTYSSVLEIYQDGEKIGEDPKEETIKETDNHQVSFLLRIKLE